MPFARIAIAVAVLTASSGCWSSSSLEISETHELTPMGSQLQIGVGLRAEFAVHVEWQKDYWVWWQERGEALPEALTVTSQSQGLIEVLPAGATEIGGRLEPGNPSPNADLVHFTPSVAGAGGLTFDDPSADSRKVVSFDARTVDDVRWGNFDAVEPHVFVGSTMLLSPWYRSSGDSLLGSADLGLIGPAGSATTLTRHESSGGPSFSIAVGPSPYAFQVTTPAIDAPLTVHVVTDDAIQGIGLVFFQAAGVEVRVGATVLVVVDPLDAQGFKILGTPQAHPSISLSSAAVSLAMTSDDAFWLEGESAGDVVATITWAAATRQVTIHVTQ
ncbi:MAG TPA: hypothetical protein VLU43_07575 [Anaeromyxobacteraceae bacterium]|nr:hypothetical protein [Anaeromyxobacteraceae bacterium]